MQEKQLAGCDANAPLEEGQEQQSKNPREVRQEAINLVEFFYIKAVRAVHKEEPRLAALMLGAAYEQCLKAMCWSLRIGTDRESQTLHSKWLADVKLAKERRDKSVASSHLTVGWSHEWAKTNQLTSHFGPTDDALAGVKGFNLEKLVSVITLRNDAAHPNSRVEPKREAVIDAIETLKNHLSKFGQGVFFFNKGQLESCGPRVTGPLGRAFLALLLILFGVALRSLVAEWPSPATAPVSPLSEQVATSSAGPGVVAISPDSGLIADRDASFGPDGSLRADVVDAGPRDATGPTVRADSSTAPTFTTPTMPVDSQGAPAVTVHPNESEP